MIGVWGVNGVSYSDTRLWEALDGCTSLCSHSVLSLGSAPGVALVGKSVPFLINANEYLGYTLLGTGLTFQAFKRGDFAKVKLSDGLESCGEAAIKKKLKFINMFMCRCDF